MHAVMHSLIHPSNTHLLSAYLMSGTVLGAEDTADNTPDQIPPQLGDDLPVVENKHQTRHR